MPTHRVRQKSGAFSIYKARIIIPGQNWDLPRRVFFGYAKKLISKYGSLEGIIEHVDELPAKQQESIKSSLGQIQMSRFLVTIKTDIQLPLALDDIKFKGAHAQEISRVFNRYEFNSLRKLMPEGMIVSGSSNATKTVTSTGKMIFSTLET